MEYLTIEERSLITKALISCYHIRDTFQLFFSLKTDSSFTNFYAIFPNYIFVMFRYGVKLSLKKKDFLKINAFDLTFTAPSLLSMNELKIIV